MIRFAGVERKKLKAWSEFFQGKKRKIHFSWISDSFYFRSVCFCSIIQFLHVFCLSFQLHLSVLVMSFVCLFSSIHQYLLCLLSVFKLLNGIHQCLSCLLSVFSVESASTCHAFCLSLNFSVASISTCYVFCLSLSFSVAFFNFFVVSLSLNLSVASLRFCVVLSVCL